VTQGKLGTEAVVSKKIKDGTIRPEDLSGEAQPAGLGSSSGDQSEPVTGVHESVRSVTIEAPSDGNVQVSASWNLYGTDVISRCGLTMGLTVEDTHAVDTETSGALIRMSGAAVRAFPVNEGPNTFNLVCYSLFGAPDIRDSSLVALFVPGSY
jgi:hypothetical protein